MNNALMIVDAWKECIDYDVKEFPNLPQDTKSFGVFLNRVCELEREKGTVIIHSPSCKPIMDEIKIHEKDLMYSCSDPINSAKHINTHLKKINVNNLYVGGFHFGRCIQRHALNFKKGATEDEIRSFSVCDKVSIVLNLSMVFPCDSWLEHIKNSKLDFSHSLWGNLGFEEIIMPASS
tara:strand:+ start:925 stop:1458 length:534 start_codon:yes stop_codon:yes gene_type:complete